MGFFSASGINLPSRHFPDVFQQALDARRASVHLTGTAAMGCKGNSSYFYRVKPQGVSCSSKQISPRWSQPRALLGQKMLNFSMLSACLPRRKTVLLSDPSYFFGLNISAASKAASVSSL